MTYLSQRKEPVFRMLFFFLMINIMQDLYKMNGKKKMEQINMHSLINLLSIYRIHHFLINVLKSLV